MSEERERERWPNADEVRYHSELVRMAFPPLPAQDPRTSIGDPETSSLFFRAKAFTSRSPTITYLPIPLPQDLFLHLLPLPSAFASMTTEPLAQTSFFSTVSWRQFSCYINLITFTPCPLAYLQIPSVLRQKPKRFSMAFRP